MSMSEPDINFRPVLWGGLTIAAVVATVIGSVFGLLRAWHEPAGGTPTGAASLVPALRAKGPTLQSAPQLNAAADRAAAASQAH
jgi:hypothetical protein